MHVKDMREAFLGAISRDSALRHQSATKRMAPLIHSSLATAATAPMGVLFAAIYGFVVFRHPELQLRSR